MKRLAFAVLIGVVAAGSQAAIVFDFEEFSPTSGGTLTTLSSTQSGITMTVTRSGGAGFDIANLPTGMFPVSWDTRALDPFANGSNDFFVANFSTAITGVDVEMTDFGADSDVMVLEAYSGANGTGSLLGTSTFTWGLNSSPNYAAVSISSTSPILSIRFRGGSTQGANSMYVDNIAIQPVPEPATLAALAAGVGLVLRRRRRA
jgi:hypothetical protein